MRARLSVLSVFLSLSLATGLAQAQTISMPALSQVGSGLEVGAYNVTLSTGQHGGVTVHIESNDPSIARVSNALATVGTASYDVFLPNGSTSVLMYVHGMEGVTGTATITASAPGFTAANRPAVVVTPACDISALLPTIDTLDPADPFSVRVGLPNAGNTAVGTPQVVRAGGGLTATVTNSNATAGQLITTLVTGQSVTVPINAGQSVSPASVASGGVALDGLAVGSTVVAATIPGFTPTTSASQTVDVTTPTISVNAFGNVGAGLMTSANASLSASEHGGVLVHVESSNPSAILVSPNSTTAGTTSFDVMLANGVTGVPFYVHGVENVVSAADVTVSAPNFTNGTRVANVVKPAVDMVGLLPTIDTLDPADPFQLRVGLPNGTNSGVGAPQAVRAGSPGVVATVMSVTGSVGTLVTTAATDDTVLVTIAPGNSTSPATVATGGVAFDGLALGSTIVFAQIPNFTSTTAAAQTVTVTAPTIAIAVISNVGSGLMGGQTTATLSASQHGGVTMRISSMDTTRALVSPNSSTPGTRFFDTFVANGSTSVLLVVHGLEGAVGTADIVAHVNGFVDGTRPVTIQQPSLDILGLVTSIDTLDPNDVFQIRVGLSSGTTVGTPQSVRAGSPGATATIVSSNAAFGTLVTTPRTDDTVTVHINAGSSTSPANVASGGVAFHPVAAGSATVSASIPGFLPTTNASIAVAVTSPTISMSTIGDVGAGLQGGISSASLSASQHGGVTVRIESADTTVALVSPNSSTPGKRFFTTFLANGLSVVQFIVHGLENVVGTASIVATAPGFAAGNALAHIVQPAVDTAGLAASMDVDDPDDPFTVRVGLPNAQLSQVSTPQPVRVGSPGMVATLVSATPAVGLLVTTPATDDTVLVTIPAGSSISPASVAAGGVAFTPVGVGNTLVSARIPGFTPTGSATVSVSVTDLSIAMTPIGKVGAGLQSASLTATIGVINHGGITVRVESSNPAVALVSPAFATAGAAFFDVFVANGVNTVPFFVHGVSVASATITASTPGYASGVRTADVVAPGVQVEQLADTLIVDDPNDPFLVRVGVPKSDLSSIETSQVVRAGGAPMVATVTSASAGVGALHTSSEDGASVSVTIPAGASQCGADAASGGVEFDPLSPGTSTVSAAAAGAVTLASSSTNCVVVGTTTPVGATPREFALAQNIPNPFNPTTRIRFTLAEAAHVNVSVFDVHGRLVTTLVDRAMPRGDSEVIWNGRDARGQSASSGVYFYRLTAGSRNLTKKMVMLK